MKRTKNLMPLGMVSVVAYLLHVFLGQALWEEYNPITTDISSLTALGAPNARLLNVFNSIYGICFFLFVLGMRAKATHKTVKRGYEVFHVMAVTTLLGYRLFPLTGDKTQMNFQNMMHLIVTIAVVFTTIAALFILALAYRKQPGQRVVGIIALAAAILVTLFGALNPIGMANDWNILGLTERLVIFTLQAFVFYLSFLHTFKRKKYEEISS